MAAAIDRNASARFRGRLRLSVLFFGACLASAVAWAGDVAEQLRRLETRVVVRGTVRQPPLAGMLGRDVQARLAAANRADARAWSQVQSREDWEAFRAARLHALKTSLGEFPPPRAELQVRVTGTHEGPGYRVDNVVYESRPGLLVAANLYRPVPSRESLPGIIVCTSHHQPRHLGARQDMGVTWARAGCLVLVPDHLGHGERAQHPIPDPGPHDYHFRYDTGIQLHVVGESLMGWLAADLHRGVDVLLAQPGIDRRRVIVISEPAGGGDVAAVAAALDPRITSVMVNNFGGPEPETAFPLPRDAEESFDFAGSGSWESTRNLRRSARDGFLPWSIVASLAPRHLIYYHEFYWDREHDPVWKRLQRVYRWHDAEDRCVGLAGWGFVVGSEPENTHWLPVSRELLYPTLERWFRIPNPGTESNHRRPPEELLCFTNIERPQLRKLARELGERRRDAARDELAPLSPRERTARLRARWGGLLGDVEPRDPLVTTFPHSVERLGSFRAERILLTPEPGLLVPLLLLLPEQASGPAPRRQVVVAVAQEGKQEFVKQRSAAIAALLNAGSAVCLLDVRGTGETSPGESRDRRSAATSLSSSELMLGETLVGARLRDVRSVLRYLRLRSDLDARRTVLWGDSFAPANAPDAVVHVAHTENPRPALCEPLGGLLALFTALWEDDVRTVYVRGGLSDFHSLLQSWLCHVPHDVVVPGALTAGDLADVAAALAPRRLWLEGLVDGLNRDVPDDELARRYAPARAAFGAAEASAVFRLGQRPEGVDALVEWLTK